MVNKASQAGCIMYSTTSGHQGISSPPSEGKKYHIRHSAVYMKSKQKSTLSIPSKWMEVQEKVYCFAVIL